MADVEKTKWGRIPGLSNEIIDKIAAALTNGNTRRSAANAAGVPWRTFTFWMARGRREDEARNGDTNPETQTIYIDLLYEVEFAESRAERYMVDLVYKGAVSDPRIAIEWLKRRRKTDWSERVESTGADGGPIAYNLSGLSDDELEQLAALRAKIDANTAVDGGNTG